MRSPAPMPSVLQTLNTTPMLDVMLVLLVIFLVVTPVIHSGPDLVLAGAVRGDAVPEGALTIRLSVTGELSSEFQRWSEEALAAWVARHPDIMLVLEADRRLPYRVVGDLLARLSEAGLRQANFVAVRRNPE
jgi:biopolymer transport protein ExbD